MNDPIRADIIIEGRVQGVFFRASAMEQAQRLGLRGFVRNLPDGCVEAVVEGERTQVDAFVAWCRQGPPNAQVSDVHARPTTFRDEFRTFTITR